MTHQALVARLEGAEAGSGELSAHVLLALVAPADAWVEKSIYNGEWCVYERKEKPRLVEAASALRFPVTTSLDAALSLAERVLPGWVWNMGNDLPCWAHLWIDDRNYDGNPITGDAATPALALCAAILKAHEARS